MKFMRQLEIYYNYHTCWLSVREEEQRVVSGHVCPSYKRLIVGITSIQTVWPRDKV